MLKFILSLPFSHVLVRKMGMNTIQHPTVLYSVYRLNENTFLSTFTIKLLKSGVTGEIDTTSYSSRTLCQQRRQQFGLVGQKMAAGWLGQKMAAGWLGQKMTAGWVGQKMAAGCIVQKMTTGWVGQIMAADSVHLVPIIIAQ